MLRKRKIEYDAVAEKVNTLPSREELESYVFIDLREENASHLLPQNYRLS